MKNFFLAVLLLFVALYAIALATRPREDASGQVTLVWETDTNPARQAQAALFTKLNPGIRVKLSKYSPEKILVKCATGVGPDLIDHIDYYNLGAYVDAGILLDLTPYQAEHHFGPENTYPGARGLICSGGKQYAYPANITANTLIYNKRLFRELGIPYPKDDWTIEDYFAIGRKIRAAKRPSGQRLLYATSWGNMPFLDNLWFGMGGSYFSPDGLTCTLDSPAVLKAAALYKDMLYKDKILLSAAEASAMSSQGGFGSGGIDHFGTERAAMLLIGRWFLVDAQNYPKVSGELGTVQWPRFPGLPRRIPLDARSTGINAKSHHIPEALKFISYLASAEYSQLIVAGGDSLPPNPHFAGKGEELVNAANQDPRFQQGFVDAAMNAEAADTSPYILFNTLAAWKWELASKLESDPHADPVALFKGLAKEVNLRIRQNLERSVFLQGRYEKLTGRKYRSDWWKQYQGQSSEN